MSPPRNFCRLKQWLHRKRSIYLPKPTSRYNIMVLPPRKLLIQETLSPLSTGYTINAKTPTCFESPQMYRISLRVHKKILMENQVA